MVTERVNILIEVWREWFSRLRNEVNSRKAPVTRRIIYIITAVFVIQFWAAILFSSSISVISLAFYKYYPEIALGTAGLLHRGFVHYLVNVLLIGFGGFVIESYWTPRKFTLFALLTGYLSVLTHQWLVSSWVSEPLFVYGASGFGYALAGYGFRFAEFRWGSFFVLSANSEVIENLWLVVGLSAVVMILFDTVTGRPFEHRWINFSHLIGFVLGFGVAICHRYSVTRICQSN